MKILHIKYYIILGIILFGFTACTNLTATPVTASSEYVSGENYADKVAKQDAMKASSRNSFRTLLNLKKHKEKLATVHSEEFLNGFSQGYRTKYPEYVDLYFSR